MEYIPIQSVRFCISKLPCAGRSCSRIISCLHHLFQGPPLHLQWGSVPHRWRCWRVCCWDGEEYCSKRRANEASVRVHQLAWWKMPCICASIWTRTSIPKEHPNAGGSSDAQGQGGWSMQELDKAANGKENWSIFKRIDHLMYYHLSAVALNIAGNQCSHTYRTTHLSDHNQYKRLSSYSPVIWASQYSYMSLGTPGIMSRILTVK